MARCYIIRFRKRAPFGIPESVYVFQENDSSYEFMLAPPLGNSYPRHNAQAET